MVLAFYSTSPWHSLKVFVIPFEVEKIALEKRRSVDSQQIWISCLKLYVYSSGGRSGREKSVSICVCMCALFISSFVVKGLNSLVSCFTAQFYSSLVVTGLSLRPFACKEDLDSWILGVGCWILDFSLWAVSSHTFSIYSICPSPNLVLVCIICVLSPVPLLDSDSSKWVHRFEKKLTRREKGVFLFPLA